MCADLQAPCDGVNGAIDSLMHLKDRHPHLRVVLSIGGAGSPEIFPIVASDPLLRDNFARTALGLIATSGLDGLDSTQGPVPTSSPTSSRTLFTCLLHRGISSLSAAFLDPMHVLTGLGGRQLCGNTPVTNSRGPTS